MVATAFGLSILAASACGDGTTPTGVHGAAGVVGDGRVNTIQLAPATLSIEEGVKSALTCSPMDSRGLVLSRTPSWTTSDASVAVVTPSGAVVGQRPGTATIGCTVDGKTATSAITVAASPVAFVEVSPGAGTLVVGNSIQLAGIPRDASGAPVLGREVQWLVTDTTVATVSSTGSVVGRIEGTANVIAMSGGRASMAKINVAGRQPAAVAAISIKLDNSSLNVGRFTHATATVTDETGQVLNGRSVTWSVSDARVASVVALNADKATINALGQGTAVVTATSEGQTASATVTVNVPAAAVTAPAVQSVTVSLSASSIFPGQTSQATATITDASGNVLTDRSVTWASLDPSLAVVSQTGQVTALASGAVIIRATSEGKTGDASLTVSVPPVTTVAVNLGTSTLAPGQTTQATAVARDANGNVLTGRSVSWTSLQPSIATVSISGVVTSVATGSATIRATVESKAGEAPITVATNAVSVATVSVSLAASSLAPGQTTQATAVAKDASGTVITGRTVQWSSLTPGVATVSTSGLVTAVAAGSATIRATVENKTGDSPLAVATSATADVATITVSLPSVSLAPGQTTQATAVAKDANGAELAGRTVVWSSLNPAVATVSLTGLVTALAAGSTAIRATVDTKTGDGALSVTATGAAPETPLAMTDAELPRVYLNTAVSNTPSNGRTLTVSGDLQRALDSAQAGDRIMLPCGTSYVGNFMLPWKSGTGWITLGSSGCSSVAEGQRMTPALAANLPKLRSLGQGAALRTAPGAHQWRVMLLDIATDASTSTNTWGLISLGEGNETSLDQLPSDIILDRLYLHGNTTLDIRRAVTNNGVRVAVIDSWLSEIHSKFDAQGISGWNGPGPYKYVNNFIEASAASIGSGGSDPRIANLVPADFEIRRNHLTKNLSWKGTWVLKTILETKNARRLLIEGNVMENSAQDGQQGFGLVFFSQNQQHTAPWSVTEHITIRYNVMRNVTAGFQLGAQYYTNDAVSMNHVTIRHNVVIGVDGPAQAGIGTSFGRIFQIAGVIPQLTIEHNTGFSPSSSSFIWDNVGALPDHVIRNNVVGGGQYQVFNGLQGAAAWSQEAGPGSAFLGNVVASITVPLPAGNHAPTMAQVGLVGGATAAYSPSATLDQMALAPGTWYKGAATDGTDPGANIAAVISATSGVKLP